MFEMELEKETIVQLAFLGLTLALFLVIYNFPKKALTNLRSNHRITAQSNRHFLAGAQLISRAKSTRHRSTAVSLAKSALSEADKSLALQPRDPGAHILRALALEILGHHSSAVRSLDAALSPPCVKSLASEEKADALVKRAEVKLAVNKKRRVDSAVSDLVEAVELGSRRCKDQNNVKAYCLLGQCYEIKGMRDEAIDAFQQALEIEPGSSPARDGLGRLR